MGNPKCIYLVRETFHYLLIIDDFLTNPTLLCLIQGTGSVKAGIWSRSVCINEGIDTGSKLGYIDQAKEHNMSVIIFNPNERNDPITNVMLNKLF